MKKLTDEEFAVISAAASITTKTQNADPNLTLIAYELWKIYHRHGGHLRHRLTKHLVEKMGIHE